MSTELFDFGLSFFEPFPSKKRSLTQDEYNRGYVDFYSQSLGETTGINVVMPKYEDKKEVKKETDQAGTVESGESGVVTFMSNQKVTSQNILNKEIGTYGDALTAGGLEDKNPTNIFGVDIYSGGVPKTKEQAKKGLERLASTEGLIKQGVRLTGNLLGIPSPISGTAMAFATGTSVPDPLGNQSFRPSSFVLGGIHDINMSIQYDNVKEIQNALRNGEKQTGFVTYIDGQIISRGPKSFNYTGTYNGPREVLVRMDAIEKGYLPSSYNVIQESGDRGIKDGVGGIYDERGGYQDRNGSYAYGSRKASQSLADKYGLDVAVVETILSKVRSDKTKTLSQELEKETSINKDIATTKSVITEDVFGKVKADDGVDQSDDTATSGEDTSSDMGFSTAYGGQIGEGMQSGGPAGFIGGPPEKFNDQTTIADDIPLEVPEGAFIINAPAVEYAGSEDISKMLIKAYEKAGQGVDKSGRATTIPSREQVDIMISRGEVVVPPNIAKIIGYDRLEKINNRGKREVDRRQKQSKQASTGGFINKAKGDKITVYRGEPPKNKIPLGAKLLQDRYTGSWFAPDKNFTKTYGEVAKSMKVSFDEYKKGAKKAFLKKNIARSKMENEKSGLPRNLTRKQRSQIFQSLKYIDEIADNVKQGKRSTKAFVDFLYEGVFPKEKDRATVMLLETAKRSPKVFGKLVVDSLVRNVVSKGVPVLGAIAGFAPKEMGDATLDNSGFIQYERVQ